MKDDLRREWDGKKCVNKSIFFQRSSNRQIQTMMIASIPPPLYNALKKPSKRGKNHHEPRMKIKLERNLNRPLDHHPLSLLNKHGERPTLRIQAR